MSNPPDPIARRRTDDAGLNAAQEIAPGADYATLATMACLMNRGLLTADELRAMLMRVRAANRGTDLVTPSGAA